MAAKYGAAQCGAAKYEAAKYATLSMGPDVWAIKHGCRRISVALNISRLAGAANPMLAAETGAEVTNVQQAVRQGLKAIRGVSAELGRALSCIVP